MDTQRPARVATADQEVLLAFDELPLSAAVLDRDGVIVAVNRCWEQFARENQGDPVGTGCGSSYLGVCEVRETDPTSAAAADGLRRVLEGRADSFELEYPCDSPQERRWFLMRAAPLRDESGEVRGAVVSHLNITQRRLAEIALEDRARELERSNEALSAFGRIVAHDLKEPLRGIRNYASHVLVDEAGLAHESRAKLETIERLAERTTASIDGLLRYASVGMSDLAIAPVDLGEIAAEVVDSFRPQIQAAGARVTISGRLPVVACDRFLVREAMANLVSNAIKYNDKAEKMVEIGAAAKGAGFYVRDNGIGIEPRGQRRLFEVFTRLHPPGKFGEGTGIGLSIVKRVAERHGGRVDVQSAPGEGTTFTVMLTDESQGG